MSYTYKLSPKRANVEVKINSVWGTITGNISDQQDLRSELDSIVDSIPDTSNLATKDELDTKANKTDVYTKSEIDSKNYLTSESDPTVPSWAKQPNKPTYTAREVGALPDTTVIPDISPLATKEELASSLNGKADKTEVYTKSEIDNKGFLTEHQSLEDYALKTDIPDISNLATKDEVAFKIDVYTKAEVDEKISSGGSFDSSLYYDKTATDSLLANKADTSSLNGKVDKVEGKSLVDDSEIARLATLTNYDDTEVKNQIATKANSADVYTKTEIDNMIGTISSTLDTLNGEVV